ncbi:UNVERIFIED_CONTAM: hypothetical protein RF653_17020 [Kocuria sp. CPCC 205316]|uniref:hypothetical protein n=1 Tax=Kocuria TaxID=57493 RepID=UPI0036DB1B67
MPPTEGTPWTHHRVMHMCLTVLTVTVVLAFTVGFYLWIVHRDWLLIALATWAAIALLATISADKRHSRDPSTR